MVFTYNLWLRVTLLYLVVAAILIIWSIFHPRHPLAARPIHVVLNQKNTAHNQSHNTANVMSASLTATLAGRDMAKRALTLQLLGYTLVPTNYVISGMVLDPLGESKSGANIPVAVTNIVLALVGLTGTLNPVQLRPVGPRRKRVPPPPTCHSETRWVRSSGKCSRLW